MKNILGYIGMSNSTITGDVIVNSAAALAGDVIGDVTANADVTILQTCKLKGNVYAKETVTVTGSIKGDVTTDGLITISSTGSIAGNIKCRKLCIDEGGVLIGKCEMTEKVVTD